MMKTVVLILSALIVATTAAAQTPTEEAIQSAIADGLAKKPVKNAVLSPFVSMYAVVLEGPLNRVHSAALKAARDYKPFTRADVTEAMLSPSVTATAVPDKPVYNKYSGFTVAPPARHIVLQPRGKNGKPSGEAVQPTSVETFPVEWGNAAGAKFESQGATATFDLASIPTGDFDVVVITSGPEYRLGAKQKDREKIR